MPASPADDDTPVDALTVHRQLVAVELDLCDIEETVSELRHGLRFDEDLIEVLDEFTVDLGVLREAAESCTAGLAAALRRIGFDLCRLD